MHLTLLIVTYRLRVSSATFRPHAELAGQRIAETPGFVWKIWGLDSDAGEGTSVYLFRDAASAEAFAAGPAIEQLRNGPAEQVTLRLSPVDVALSNITGAAAALTAMSQLSVPS